MVLPLGTVLKIPAMTCQFVTMWPSAQGLALVPVTSSRYQVGMHEITSGQAREEEAASVQLLVSIFEVPSWDT
jgi:hypothetical protein